MSDSPDNAAAVATVRAKARELYGTAADTPARGVLHVVSTVRAPDGRLHVIKIGPAAPKSARDFFLLNYWRAHCNAILTTARIVRSEPQLSHALQGEYARELAVYRSQVLHEREPPACAILTRAADLPLEHPLWRDANRNLVLTSPEQVTPLRAALGTRAEVFGIAALDARKALAWLDGRARTILVEAGPSVASGLYSEPALVDHLMLSLCDAAVAPEAIGGALPEAAQLFAGMVCLADTLHQEQSGPWRFQRWIRR